MDADQRIFFRFFLTSQVSLPDWGIICWVNLLLERVRYREWRLLKKMVLVSKICQNRAIFHQNHIIFLVYTP